jgi:signal transduction histidine kinase
VEGARGRAPVVTVRLDPNPVLAQAEIELPLSRYLRVEVEDSGVGMDEDTCRRAFVPFFTTKPVGHATGLGLPAVRAIVQQHGGRVECRSTPGTGTYLTVFLPLPEEE